MRDKNKKIIHYEYQRFFNRKLWIWIAVCFLANIVLWGFQYRESEEDLIYKDIVEEYRGISDRNKIAEIHEKTEYYSRVLAEHMTVSEEYARGEMDDEEYQAFIADYKYAKNHINGWKKLQENASRFEIQDAPVYFFYDVSWEKLLGNHVEWIFILLFVSLFVPYFYLDRDSKFAEVSKSYYRYGEVQKCRRYFAIGITLILQVIWIITELIVVLSASSLPDLSYSACSLGIYASVTSPVSLIHFYLLKIILSLLKQILGVLLLYFFAAKLKNKMQATVLILVYLIITSQYF